MTRRNTLRLSAEKGASVWTHLGVIDLGSNAIRLQVARVFEDGDFRIVHDEREPVRLGEDAFRTGTLSKDASQRALQTLARYAETARRHGAVRVRAVATSAVREAANGEEFARAVEREHVEALYRTLSPVAVPRLRAPQASLAALRPDERIVASLINDKWDVSTLVLASPLRELQTLRAIERMVELNLVAL
ncbi:MAG TPA: hypothetical protein DFS52_11880 [Myxococcales bacterium]|nr:hypothetical protein [Myxococcales bacterium]